jgi:hypothetical protein
MSDQILARLVNFKRNKQSIQRHCKVDDVLKITHETNFILVRATLTTMIENDKSLYLNARPSGHRAIFFLPSCQLKNMENTEEILIDRMLKFCLMFQIKH